MRPQYGVRGRALVMSGRVAVTRGPGRTMVNRTGYKHLCDAFTRQYIVGTIVKNDRRMYEIKFRQGSWALHRWLKCLEPLEYLPGFEVVPNWKYNGPKGAVHDPKLRWDAMRPNDDFDAWMKRWFK